MIIRRPHTDMLPAAAHAAICMEWIQNRFKTCIIGTYSCNAPHHPTTHISECLHSSIRICATTAHRCTYMCRLFVTIPPITYSFTTGTTTAQPLKTRLISLLTRSRCRWIARAVAPFMTIFLVRNRALDRGSII